MHLTESEFRSRFTMAEKRAIYTLAATAQGVDVRVWLDDLKAAEYVDTQNPLTNGSVKALEQMGLLAPGRAAEILGEVAEQQAAFGFTLGQVVRVLPPFNADLAMQYAVEGFTADAVLIAGGQSFAPLFLEAV